MSAVVRCRSKMTSKHFLLNALRKINVPDELIVEGRGDNVKIDRRFHSGSREVVYSKSRDADEYICQYSPSDSYALQKMVDAASFTGAVEQWYNALVVKDTLKKQGFMPSIKKVGDKLRVYAMS